ncbi:hypothetical protein G6F37_005417 [Rhizopus arrhizus]|nr:hypothetical protein G6F38_006765 [Rhizopus arrhizus]KAG1158849.1 hypothetical protein G6F37_005417 [Rhizopus arrhizus]
MTLQQNYETMNYLCSIESYGNKYSNLSSFDQCVSMNDITLYNWDNYSIPSRFNYDHSERGVAGFVSKLYQCLQDKEQNYVRWCKHKGIDMFVIDCIPEFTEVVLPKLFKHCKFASFIYGFQRDTDARKSKDSHGRDRCRWYHTHFRPGQPDLFHLIRRKPPRYSRGKKESEDEASDKRRGSVSSTISSSSMTLHPLLDSHLQETCFGQDVLTTAAVTPNLYLPTTFPYSIDVDVNPMMSEQELAGQLAELQEKYTEMYTTLTDERNKACSLIQTQKTRIERLENSLHPPSLIQGMLWQETTPSLCDTLDHHQKHAFFQSYTTFLQPQKYEFVLSTNQDVHHSKGINDLLL